MVFFCQAQTYQVYTVRGDVKCNNGLNESLATVGIVLQDNTKLTVPNGGRIVVLNETNRQLHTINGATSGTVAELLKKDDVHVLRLTDSFFSYIKSKLNESIATKDNSYLQSAGTSYREGDSIILQTLFPNDTISYSTYK